MSANTSVIFILGTRPEIIKLAPVVRECKRRDIPFTLVHTGQHYSERLDDVFFEQLSLPEPDHDLDIGSSSHGHQTGRMLTEIEPVLEAHDAEWVLVQGDTNSVLAGALVTSKMNAKLGHVEAGLRSFDKSMPEEINRVVADHVADHMFAPTPTAKSHLINENLPPENVHVTGNTIVDAVKQHVQIAEDRSNVLPRFGLESDDFLLLTVHRAENVDNRVRFASILSGVKEIARRTDSAVIYPVHPRSRQRLTDFGLDVPDEIRLIDPQEFLDFLLLERSAQLVITDSGGVQEEACILGTPCVTVRDNTERPETVEVGANIVAGIDPESIVSGAEAMLKTNQEWDNPFGDGTAAKSIVNVVLNEYTENE